jgi:hypothetical protein
MYRVGVHPNQSIQHKQGEYEFERSSDIPMDTNMSKSVGGHYLYIPKCIYRQHYVRNFEVATMVA